MILVSDSATPLPIVNQSRLFEGRRIGARVFSTDFLPFFLFCPSCLLFLRLFHAFWLRLSPRLFFFATFFHFFPAPVCAFLNVFSAFFYALYLYLFCASFVLFPHRFPRVFEYFFFVFFPPPLPVLALRLSCVSSSFFIAMFFSIYFVYFFVCYFMLI